MKLYALTLALLSCMTSLNAGNGMSSQNHQPAEKRVTITAAERAHFCAQAKAQYASVEYRDEAGNVYDTTREYERQLRRIFDEQDSYRYNLQTPCAVESDLCAALKALNLAQEASLDAQAHEILSQMHFFAELVRNGYYPQDAELASLAQMFPKKNEQ
jgi:hypothetical protein